MPRRRKKSSRSNRKPPLAFSESPLDLSRQFSSPVTGAVNPVTAEVISLQDQLPATKWVSPQFDPNAPPSVRRRRGRRRQQTEEVRTACSQNPNHKRAPALADLENGNADENQVCDRRKLNFDVSEVLEQMSVLELGSNEDRVGRIVGFPTTESSDKENKIVVEGEDPIGNSTDHPTMYGGDTGSSAMGVCSYSWENLDKQSWTEACVSTPCMLPCRTSQKYFDSADPCQTRKGSTDTPSCKDKLDGSSSGTCRTPLCEANGVKARTVICPACKGACLPLATDTPVNEYNLRVSVRNRRGRLPKAAWEQLIKDVS